MSEIKFKVDPTVNLDPDEIIGIARSAIRRESLKRELAEGILSKIDLDKDEALKEFERVREELWAKKKKEIGL